MPPGVDPPAPQRSETTASGDAEEDVVEQPRVGLRVAAPARDGAANRAVTDLVARVRFFFFIEFSCCFLAVTLGRY
jgi:hypothetical protein